MPTDETFLVLGGGGLAGAQVVRQVAGELKPRRIVVASLYQQEVREALRGFQREFPAVHFVGFWGDVFAREDFNTRDRRSAQRLRGRGSAEITRDAYLCDDISIGAVVGWIFNNETGGYRIK